jgi:hypothetical protein
MAFRSLAFSYRISHNTISGIIYDTCDAIWECLVEKHVPFPTTELLEKSARDYEHVWNFPNCVASIDGKHVRIKCPKLSGSRYFSYKGFFSVILQGLVDVRYKFLSVDVGAFGRQSDSGVFSQSNLYQRLESGSFPFPQPKQIPGTTTKLPYVILGDQGYPLKDYLMRPYGTDNAAFCPEIAAYNYRHSRARRTVECAFGILVSKWRCLKTELQVLPEHVDKLVLTACLLHNLIIDKEGIDEVAVQKITSSNTAEGEASVIRGPRRYNRATREAYNIRERFKVYFNGEGAVDFQYNQIDTCVE